MTKTATPEPALQQLPLTELKPAKDNLREKLTGVDELAASIKSEGLIEPLIAVAENGHYKIVAGHRRFAALKLAGLTTADVIVRGYDEQQRLAVMLVENLQNEPLTVLEEARGYQRLADEFGLTQQQIATRVGRGQGHISKRLALLGLPAKVQGALDSGGITVSEALQITRLNETPKRAEHALALVKQNWQADRAVEHELREHEKAQKTAAAKAKLKADGVKLLALQKTSWGSWELPKGTAKLADGKGYRYGYGEPVELSPAKHKSEPCHAATVDEDGEIVYLCLEPASHQTAKRKPVSRADPARRDANELAKAAKARREFAGGVAKRGLPAIEHAALLLDTLISSAHSEVLKLACRMLGLDAGGNGQQEFGKALREFADKSTANRGRVEIAIGFGTHEEFMTGPWGGWENHVGYVQLLEQNGYTPTPAERKKLPKAKTKAAA